MPSDAKKKQQQKKKEAAKARQASSNKKPTSKVENGEEKDLPSINGAGDNSNGSSDISSEGNYYLIFVYYCFSLPCCFVISQQSTFELPNVFVPCLMSL